MKFRMFALLLAVGLLCGTVCGCDYVIDSSDNLLSSSTTATDDTEATTTTTATTATTATTTTRKITTTTTTTTTKKITTTKKPTTTEQLVWIPESGTKYHSKSSCSNMKNPSRVPKSYAIEMGYSPCKRCY